jgi:hypothetical protein
MTTPAQLQPYTLQASCELAHDYFLTTDLIIGTDDKVIPFVNPHNNNLVEAIVFTTANGGAIYHLQRDASSATGWTPMAISMTNNLTNLTNVAVAADSTDVYMMVFGYPDNLSDAPSWLTRLDSASAWNDGYNAKFYDLGLDQFNVDTNATFPIFRGGISPQDDAYFYTVVTDTRNQTINLFGWLAGPNFENGAMGYQLFQTFDATSVTVQDCMLLYSSDQTSPAPVGYSLVLSQAGTSEAGVSVYAQQQWSDYTTAQFGDSPLVDAGTSNATALLWAWATPGSNSGVPGYAVQTPAVTWFVPEDGSDAVSLTDDPAATSNSVAVWTGALDVVNALDHDGTLNTVLEIAPGSWQSAIPVVPGKSTDQDGVAVPGLAAIFGVPTDPTQSTLFAIGLDESLSVLTLDSSGWTQTLVRQEATKQVEIDSYRVQIAVLDANNVPVPGAGVSVLPDRPVGIWQPDGSTYATPDALANLTADYTGRVTFSVPAEELDCAVLTVQPLGPSGGPAGSPLAVIPDTDVRGFLNGTGSLTDVGPINGGNALLAAKTSTGGDLFPGLTGLSGDPQAQQQACADSAKALSTFIAAGSKTTPADGTQSLLLQMTGKVPTVQHSTEAFAFGPAPTGDLTFSLEHVFDTIGHALRHGAAKLASITAHFVDEATGWVISIGAEIGGALQNFTNLVISDIKDAFHAIGGFFQALGADIENGVGWLLHNVIDLLKAAWANGQTVASAIGAAPAGLATQVQKLNITVDNFFTNLESEVTDWIDNKLAPAVSGKTLGSAPNQTPPASGDTGSSSAQSGLAKDFGMFTRVINDTPGMWLYHKFQQDVPPIVSLGMPNVTQSKYDTIVNDQLATDWADGIALVEALQKYCTDIISSIFGASSSSAKQGTLSDLYASFTSYKFLNDSDSVVVKLLKFCDDVAQTLLDIVIMVLEDLTTVITTPFKLVSATSLLGLLLDDVLHIDPTLTVAEVVGMVIGFPATLVAKVLGKGDTLPTLPTLPTGDGAGTLALTDMDPTVKLWLGILGGTTQAIWGFADIIGDLQTFKGEDGKRGTQSGVIDMFDIWCPLFESFFLYPYDADNGNIDWLLPWIVLSGLVPSVFGLLGLFSWDKATQTLKAAGADDSILNGLNDYVSPWVQSFSGGANTAFSIAWQVETGDTYWVDLAGTALGNLSFLLAPAGTYWLNASLEDVPVIVKMIIDAIGNVGAAVCIYQSNSLPPSR